MVPSEFGKDDVLTTLDPVFGEFTAVALRDTKQDIKSQLRIHFHVVTIQMSTKRPKKC